MEEKADGTGLDGVEFSVEEFEALEGTHEFSEKYLRNKKKMLKKYCRSVYWPGRGRWGKAAAALFLMMSVPIIVRAASGSEFFYRVWGGLGKENVESHEEVVYDEGKGIFVTVTYPQREYTDRGMERAEELTGGAVSCQSLVKEIGDTKLQVLAAAYDGSAAVVEFTLEREGGVEGLLYGQLYNESKGAWFTKEAPFWVSFADCSENIWVDLDKSTEELVYCYGYLVTKLTDQPAGLTLEIYENTDGEGEGVMQPESIFIPIQKEMGKKEYINKEGGTAIVSPMSLDVDCRRGLGLAKDQIYDPWHIYYAAVNYKNGDVYVIHEHEIKGIHSSSTDIENTGYVCGTQDNHLVFVFNRLVDVENVESVVINETVYTSKAGPLCGPAY
jgi:hypothetical protein